MVIQKSHLHKGWATAALVWFAFILFATIANAQTLSRILLRDIFSYDKPIHMMLFGVQAILIIKSIPNASNNNKWVTQSCLLSVVYGVTTEVLQGVITTTRFFDYFDMLANTLGCLFVWIWFRNRKQVAS
jgi:hypothetical protein